ncbi:MAG: hypothetical protein AB7U75_09675 [Hyphomicrobiaceae bacterium]
MSGEILSMKSETARFDPEREFGTPEKLAESPGLTRGEKIATLERWAQQILDELSATSEGMPTNPAPGHGTAMLDRVNETIALLKNRKPAA